MNKEQRKYLAQRVENAFVKKRAEIVNAHKVSPAFASDKEKAKFLEELFASFNVPITLKYNSYYRLDNLITEEEEKLEGKRKEARAAEDNKLKQLSELKHKVMDEIMLGTDAVALAEAINQIEQFKGE